LAISKPFKRTCRQLADGSYGNNGHWKYLLHRDFAQDPQHYVRAFLVIQKDLINLLEFVEPCDQNSQTYSFRTHELLMRTCIEIEANFTAILKENIFSKSGNLNMSDYKLINKTHRLSSYKVVLPIWKGSKRIRRPFEAWENEGPLLWYQGYNKSKHSRFENFDKATLDNLIDSVSGLVVLLSSQFWTEDYSPADKSLTISSNYSYHSEFEMETAAGGFFGVIFPKDWPEHQRYGFKWETLNKEDTPIDRINYDLVF